MRIQHSQSNADQSQIQEQKADLKQIGNGAECQFYCNECRVYGTLIIGRQEFLKKKWNHGCGNEFDIPYDVMKGLYQLSFFKMLMK